MQTILESNRRKIGDFEVVEFVDEGQIESLRKKLDVDVPLELHWTWEYGSEVEELRALYERGKSGQWNAEEDLDWSIPLPRDEWFMPQIGASLLSSLLTEMGADEKTCREAAWDEFSHLISQLLHGEQAALQLCGQLVNSCPTMDQKWYAGSQVIDEVRHVEVFSKFLHRKMGVVDPIDPDAEGPARQAARRADLADEVPRHADALRGHGGRHHGHRAAGEHESAASRTSSTASTRTRRATPPSASSPCAGW